jgi:hypothetical protein
LRRCFWGPSLAATLLDVLTLLPAGPGLVRAAAGDPGEGLPLYGGRCWVCRELAHDAAGYVSQLAALFEQEDHRPIYAQSRGLCLPHVQACAAAASPEGRAWLLAAEMEHWRRLREDLAELVRKASPPLRAQQTRAEETAPTRCLQKLVGTHGRRWPGEPGA